MNQILDNKTLSKITDILAVVVLIFLSLIIFANSMTKSLGHDEQMYCTAGALLAQGKMIYRDFSYVAQMPYHPLLCAALFKALNTTYFLLVGRILSVFCDILVLVCIVGIYRYIFASFPFSGVLLGLAAALLYVFNPLVDYANGFAWNHDVIILCVLLSFWLFVAIDFNQKSKYLKIVIIAGLLTLATCMRVTTALVQLLFFIILLSQPAKSVKERFKIILPFLIATAVVLLWPIWTMILAPHAFFLNLFWIPKLNSQWLHQIGMVHNKLDLILTSLTMPGYFVIILIAVYLCFAIVVQRRRLTIPESGKLLLALFLPVIFFIIALIPPTMWRQYLAMPVPFLLTGAALPLLYLRKLTDKTYLNSYFKTAYVLITACVFVSVVSYPFVLYRVPKLFEPKSWVPVRLHRVSEDIAKKTKDPKLILTLAPLYALEGNCDIYMQLSAGPFVYRVADRLSPWNLEITNTVGPRTLGKLIEKSPPSAVILGVEQRFLEASLFQTAKLNPDQWQAEVYSNGAILYFRR
ncbi:MAG: hypothetical protein AMJ43_09065 [Coxiella sp. DG_40]|nr:MAG: hypothetical protein AMJ43_09065 [Coxiella sp. DG_40]